MNEYINKLKKYAGNEDKRSEHIKLMSVGVLALLSIVLFTGGRARKLITGTINFVEAKTGQFIDNHEYRELPWDILLKEEDKQFLAQGDVPKLPELDIKEQDVAALVSTINSIADETTTLLKDRDLYADSLDNDSLFRDYLSSTYKNDEVFTVYKEVLDDVYSKSYTYPEELYPVSLKQEISGENNYQWIVNFEFRTLQDSTDYLVYPITLTFSEDFEYLNGDSGKPFESAAGTRPLSDDSLVSEDGHKEFLTEYGEFTRLFNKDIYSGKTDMIHLDTMATDDMPLELLYEMYEASRGDLSNASITSWEMNDKKAEAVSEYRLDIPENNEGDILSVYIEFSRPQGDIVSMRKLD